MNIGENIKKYRKENKLTQEQLAIKSGISRNALINYENNKRVPSFEMLVKISTALQVPIDIICGLNVKPVTVPELNLIVGYENKETGEYIDDIKEHIDTELNLLQLERQQKEYEATPEYKKEMERLESEYSDETWLKYRSVVNDIEVVLNGLHIQLSLLTDNDIPKIMLLDLKDGYTKIFETYEEAELFFNEIKHGIQSSVDRLKYYDKNNK